MATWRRAASTHAGTPLDTDQHQEGPPMTAIAVIATFIVVIFMLNVIDFGRLD